jgi:CBS domain-containing protein
MICEGLMNSDVTSVDPQTTAQQAALLMREEHIGFLPICDAQGRVLGTITDRDIAVRIVADNLPATEAVAKFMTPRVVACRATDDLSYALELMSQEKVSRILCVNDRGQLEGVISLSDIVEVDSSSKAASTLRNVSQREVRSDERAGQEMP